MINKNTERQYYRDFTAMEKLKVKLMNNSKT